MMAISNTMRASFPGVSPCALATLLLALVGCDVMAGVPVLHVDRPLHGEVSAQHSAQFAIDMVGGSRALIEVQQTDLDVVVVVTSPDGNQQSVDLSPIGQLEIVTIDARADGVQRIEIAPYTPGTKGAIEIRLRRLMTPDEVTRAAAEEERLRQAFIAWVSTNALRLNTPLARSGLADLDGLGAMIGDAHLVAMGEPTHGSREAFQLKHRLFEYLVRERGFTAIAFEFSMPEARAIDHYVLTGEGDPAQALAGTYFWIYNTEEVLDLIQWIREYNLDPAHARKLHVYGIDMQTPVLAARTVQAFLRAVDHQPTRSQRNALNALADPLMAYGAVNFTDRDRASALLRPLETLAAVFDSRAAAWTQAADAEQYAWARQALRLCAQNMEMLIAGRGEASGAIRDRAMADNARWALQREGDDGRLAVWAHNFHVQKRAHPQFTTATMGQHLAEAFKDDARFVGIRFNRGGMQATDLDAAQSVLGRRNFIMSPAKGSLEATLSETGLTYALFDLRALPAAIVPWLKSPRGVREAGSGMADVYLNETFMTLPDGHYDLEAFIEATTPARALPMSTAFPHKLSPRWVDGSFEAKTSLDASPWLFDPSSTAFGYRAEIVDDDAHDGARHLRLLRKPAQRFGAKPGFVTYLIDAQPMRGKTLTLKLWSRFRADSEDAGAYVAFESLSTRTSTPEMGVAADRINRLSAGSKWRATDVKLKVGDDATHLRLRFLLAGDGQLDVDSVTLSSP